VPDIGLSLKILVDSLPDVAVLATGSASFDLANKISEPLTGRKLTFMRYPLGFAELAETPVLSSNAIRRPSTASGAPRNPPQRAHRGWRGPPAGPTP
jgi:predicted AAA+ superfamily ATPase